MIEMIAIYQDLTPSQKLIADVEIGTQFEENKFADWLVDVEDFKVGGNSSKDYVDIILARTATIADSLVAAGDDRDRFYLKNGRFNESAVFSDRKSAGRYRSYKSLCSDILEYGIEIREYDGSLRKKAWIEKDIRDKKKGPTVEVTAKERAISYAAKYKNALAQMDSDDINDVVSLTGVSVGIAQI